MKKGKKFLCMLFSVVMLISCMATSVWAAETATQDGLNAVIQTDKDTYAANEDIQINVTVTNTNAFEVKNVSIENFLPDDLTLKSGSLKSDMVNLKPNETLTLSCVAVLEKSEEPTSSTPNPGDPGTTSSGSTSDEPEDTGSSTKPNESGTISSESNTSEDSSTISSKPMVNPNNPPQTGDNFPIFLSFLILVISAIAIVAIVIAFKKEKKTRKIISLILCCAIGASSITAVGFIRASAEESQSTLSIDKNITIDNKFYNIQCNVIYEDKTTWYQGIDEDHVVNSEKDGSGFDYINNRIVIGFEKESTEEQKQAAVEAVNGVILGISESGTEYQVQIHETENLSELRKICDDVSSMPGVILCFYEKLYELSAVPNDPWKDTTDWDEENPDGLNWWLEAIEAPSAWDYNERFSNIRIGVVDGGFETNHEDLNLTVINPNENITNNKSRDHGTHVAGIIGATANNGIGITGIVWNKDLYCADVPLLTDDKDEQHTSILSTYDGIEQLLKLDCKVINVSLGTTLADDPKAILEEGKTAVYYMCKWKNELNKDDFLIIQSADNNGIDSRRAGSFASVTDESIDAYFKEYPGDAQKYSKSDIYQHFMIVGAIEQDGKDYKLCDKDNIMGFLSGFDSNYGDGISIVAPGMDIYSCSEMGGLNGNYVSLFGTSMAAPIVSGVASLVWSINPGFSADEVKEIVCTSTNKNASSSNENDSRESYPIVNAKLAVEEAIRRTDDVASISGTVVDAETGEPLEANISATSEDGMMAFATSNPETGDFSIQNLPAGKYNVVISKEGYRNYTFSPTLTEGMIFVLTEPVELEKSLPDPVPPTEISGSVKDKSTDLFLKGVKVSVYDESGSELVATAVTNSEGKFTVSLEKEGIYDLKFFKGGYEEATIDNFRAVASYGSNSVGLISLTPMEDEDTHYIYTAEDFNAIRNDLDGNYILMNDIDLSMYSENWEPIGSYKENVGIEASGFSGHFNGNGHTIYGFNVSKFDDTDIFNQFGKTYGLFGVMYGSTIENLKVIANIDVRIYNSPVSRINAGIIAGYGFGTIKNCKTSGNILINVEYPSYEGAGLSVGGIAGSPWDQDIQIIDSQNYANISVYSNNNSWVEIGGIISRGTAEHCYNAGNIYCRITGGDANCIVSGITYDNPINSCNAASFMTANNDYVYSLEIFRIGRDSKNCVANQDMLINGEPVKDSVSNGTGMDSELLEDWYNNQ